MARTPPKLNQTIGPSKVLGVLRRAPSPAIERRPALPKLPALTLGRAFDAAGRSDSDYFMSDQRPYQPLIEPLRRLLLSLAPNFDGLLKNFEREDPVEFCVGFDNLQKRLTDHRDPDAVIQAASLGAELLGQLGADPALSPADACALLTYGALELYYYRRATVEAKLEFDRLRELIFVATGRYESSINQNALLGMGLQIWEGWQALRSLEQLFGSLSLSEALERDTIAPSLFAGVAVIFAMRAPASDPSDAVERLLSLHEASPKAKALAQDFLQNRIGPPPAQTETSKAPQSSSRLAVKLRSLFITPTAPVSLGRSPASIIEDMSSLVERYEILLEGDDNSLVFEIAPMLQEGIALLYHELSASHPALEASLFEEDETQEEKRRHQRALQSLVEKYARLTERFSALRGALETGELEIGFPRD